MAQWIRIDESNTSAFAFQSSRNGAWSKVFDDQDLGGTSMQTRLSSRTYQRINATASIDGGSADTLIQDIGTKSYHQRLYASPQLDFGNHTLLVTQLSDDFPLIIDYAQVDGEQANKPVAFIASPSAFNSTQPQTVSTSSSESTVLGNNEAATSSVITAASTSTPSSSTTIPTSSQFTSTTPSPSNTSSSGSSSLDFDGVAGIVISTATVLGAAVLVVLWLKRKRQKAKQAMRPRPYSPASTVSPFPLPLFASSPTRSPGGTVISEKPSLRTSDSSNDYTRPPVRERSSTFLQGSSTMAVELSSVSSTSSEDLHSREPPSRAFKALMSASPSKSVFEPPSARQRPPPSPDTDSTWSMSTTPRGSRLTDLAAAMSRTFESEPAPIRRMTSVPRRNRAATLGSELPTYSESIRWSRSAQFAPSGPRRMGELRDYPPPPESPPPDSSP
ncbi:hypothetical protein NP233_g4880 [Leucocoprinus birnbaumii]|uniref:Uncharacterized protein n=1 Tax=Leucocoprinus birnbaumii TaxID=56174 RepID=A0AAD5W0B3_9AGAR|nr:hypothetical protein NP233_g4880 [Leucocoprinus birnbaumii]